MSADPRTVRVRHPEKGTEKVTPEVAVVLERQGWERVGGPVGDVEKAVEKATAPLKARIAELEQQLADAAPPAPPADSGLPDKADELIAWIGQDPERAKTAAQAEHAKGDKARKTVIDHAVAILTPANPTNPGGQSAKED